MRKVLPPCRIRRATPAAQRKAALTFQTRAFKAALVPEWAGLVGLPGEARAPAEIVPFTGGRHAA